MDKQSLQHYLVSLIASLPTSSTCFFPRKSTDSSYALLQTVHQQFFYPLIRNIVWCVSRISSCWARADTQSIRSIFSCQGVFDWSEYRIRMVFAYIR